MLAIRFFFLFYSDQCTILLSFYLFVVVNHIYFYMNHYKSIAFLLLCFSTIFSFTWYLIFHCAISTFMFFFLAIISIEIIHCFFSARKSWMCCTYWVALKFQFMLWICCKILHSSIFHIWLDCIHLAMLVCATIEIITYLINIKCEWMRKFKLLNHTK